MVAGGRGSCGDGQVRAEQVRVLGNPHPASTAATASTPSGRTAAGVPRSVAINAAIPAKR